jgi:ferredoxin
VRITFDRGACQGHNRCSGIAPELFDVDADGFAVLLIDTDGVVPTELEGKAALCADNCPEFAIAVHD